jgi:hypothetical protein
MPIFQQHKSIPQVALIGLLDWWHQRIRLPVAVKKDKLTLKINACDSLKCTLTLRRME